MIRKMLLVLAVGMLAVSPARAEEEDNYRGRYYYDPNDRVMVDTQTGKIYGFLTLVNDAVLTEVDFVNGRVRPVSAFRLDKKMYEEDYDRIKESDPYVNWSQRVRKILPSWTRSS